MSGTQKNKMRKKRITLSLDEEIVKKIRKKQAKLLRKSRKSVSFSAIVNQYLKELF
ncbi:MAG: hypothetical protein IIA83_01785 [Thaumarchaeota archaeon]|nr:hypothetical protein [Nitrososphaerota archaeon]